MVTFRETEREKGGTERTLSFAEECWLINVGEMIELEKSRLKQDSLSDTQPLGGWLLGNYI